MNEKEALTKLKAAMLCAQTLGELYALMEDYSYEEFMQIYNQLPDKQQAAINAICDRDSQSQLAAITSVKDAAVEVGSLRSNLKIEVRSQESGVRGQGSGGREIFITSL